MPVKSCHQSLISDFVFTATPGGRDPILARPLSCLSPMVLTADAAKGSPCALPDPSHPSVIFSAPPPEALCATLFAPLPEARSCIALPRKPTPPAKVKFRSRAYLTIWAPRGTVYREWALHASGPVLDYSVVLCKPDPPKPVLSELFLNFLKLGPDSSEWMDIERWAIRALGPGPGTTRVWPVLCDSFVGLHWAGLPSATLVSGGGPAFGGPSLLGPAKGTGLRGPDLAPTPGVGPGQVIWHGQSPDGFRVGGGGDGVESMGGSFSAGGWLAGYRPDAGGGCGTSGLLGPYPDPLMVGGAMDASTEGDASVLPPSPSIKKTSRGPDRALDLHLPSERAGAGPPRASARLSMLGEANALGRAMNRKANLREGISSCSGPSMRTPSRSKIKKKAARCGVRLSDDEAMDFQAFLAAGV